MRRPAEVHARSQQGTATNLGGVHRLQAGRGRAGSRIDRKVENIRRAVEEGLNDASWANTRLRELHTERESLVAASRKASGPPQLDAAIAMDYRRQADKLLQQGGQAERKQLLRTLVGEVKLTPRTWR